MIGDEIWQEINSIISKKSTPVFTFSIVVFITDADVNIKALLDDSVATEYSVRDENNEVFIWEQGLAVWLQLQ